MNARTLDLAPAIPSASSAAAPGRIVALGLSFLQLAQALLARSTQSLAPESHRDASFPINELRALSAELSESANGYSSGVGRATRRYLDAASR